MPAESQGSFCAVYHKCDVDFRVTSKVGVKPQPCHTVASIFPQSAWYTEHEQSSFIQKHKIGRKEQLKGLALTQTEGGK